LENLKIIEERDLVAHVREISRTFLTRLNGFAGHPLVAETRGVGLIGAIEVGHESTAGTPGALGARLNGELQARGLISRNMGDALAFCPPLSISEAQIDEMFDIFAAALEAVTKDLGA